MWYEVFTFALSMHTAEFQTREDYSSAKHDEYEDIVSFLSRTESTLEILVLSGFCTWVECKIEKFRDDATVKYDNVSICYPWDKEE